MKGDYWVLFLSVCWVSLDSPKIWRSYSACKCSLEFCSIEFLIEENWENGIVSGSIISCDWDVRLSTLVVSTGSSLLAANLPLSKQELRFAWSAVAVRTLSLSMLFRSEEVAVSRLDSKAEVRRFFLSTMSECWETGLFPSTDFFAGSIFEF